MSNIGYKRVSTVDQNTDRQLAGVNLDKVFEDKLSGKDTNRRAYKRVYPIWEKATPYTSTLLIVLDVTP